MFEWWPRIIDFSQIFKFNNFILFEFNNFIVVWTETLLPTQMHLQDNHVARLIKIALQARTAHTFCNLRQVMILTQEQRMSIRWVKIEKLRLKDQEGASPNKGWTNPAELGELILPISQMAHVPVKQVDWSNYYFVRVVLPHPCLQNLDKPAPG